MRHFPPVLLAARPCGVGSWVSVGGGMKYDPPPSLKGVHAGRLDYYNNNNNRFPQLGTLLRGPLCMNTVLNVAYWAAFDEPW